MSIRYVESINQALHEAMSRDENVILIGEDITDPYGGAFKAAKGISTKFPNQTFSSSISEQAIVGLSVGAALSGLRPVAEIMFADFIFLASDQLINHAAKFPAMFNGLARVPMVVRTASGGGRGYGPTHSQAPEKHLLGVPGLRVVAPTPFHDPGAMLVSAIFNDDMPVVFIENKLFYGMALRDEKTRGLWIDQVEDTNAHYPIARVRNFDPDKTSPDAILVAISGAARQVEEALVSLAREEIWVEAYFPSELNHASFDVVDQAVSRIGNVLFVEESTDGFGWSSEAIRQMVEKDITATMRVAYSAPGIIPAEKSMETAMLVTPQQISNKIIELL